MIANTLNHCEYARIANGEALTGVSGYDDLTPEGGVAHLTGYSINPDVKQFITPGKGDLGFHLFPNDLNAWTLTPA